MQRPTSGKAQLVDSDLHTFGAVSGVSRFTVALSFVLPENELSVEDRYELAPQAVAEALGGMVAENEPVEQSGHAGRNQRIEADGRVLHTRVFIVGNRVYQAQVAFQTGTLHPKAVEYYLDSFAIVWRPETPRPTSEHTPTRSGKH